MAVWPRVPASVTVPAGSQSAVFAISTSARDGARTPVTISATLNGVTKTASLTVDAGVAATAAPSATADPRR